MTEGRYPAPPPLPEPEPVVRNRPRTVTGAGLLLVLVAATIVVNSVMFGMTHVLLISTVRELSGDTEFRDVDAFASSLYLLTFIFAGPALLLALTLVVLSVLSMRGQGGARTAALAIGGILLPCYGIVACSPSYYANPRVSSPDFDDLPDAADVTQLYDERLGSWVEPITTTINLVQLLALAVALLLLTLPSANRFFRKPPPVSTPPPPLADG